MIEYLLNGKYPGADIGPEPTTDIFAHIQYSETPVTIDGPTLAQDKTYPLKVCCDSFKAPLIYFFIGT